LKNADQILEKYPDHPGKIFLNHTNYRNIGYESIEYECLKEKEGSI
jgi:hypothetical protein